MNQKHVIVTRKRCTLFLMDYITVDTYDLKNMMNFKKMSKMMRITVHISKCPAVKP